MTTQHIKIQVRKQVPPYFWNSDSPGGERHPGEVGVANRCNFANNTSCRLAIAVSRPRYVNDSMEIVGLRYN